MDNASEANLGDVCADKTGALSSPVNLADAVDEIVDGKSKLVEVATSSISDGDSLNVVADVNELPGNIWGDTPGVGWGHGESPILGGTDREPTPGNIWGTDAALLSDEYSAEDNTRTDRDEMTVYSTKDRERLRAFSAIMNDTAEALRQIGQPIPDKYDGTIIEAIEAYGQQMNTFIDELTVMAVNLIKQQGESFRLLLSDRLRDGS